MNQLTQIGRWLILSSKDSRKFSLTVKSVLLGAIPLLALVGIDTSILPEGVDFVVDALEKVLIAISSLFALWGFVRKLKTTFAGTNSVINGN